MKPKKSSPRKKPTGSSRTRRTVTSRAAAKPGKKSSVTSRRPKRTKAKGKTTARRRSAAVRPKTAVPAQSEAVARPTTQTVKTPVGEEKISARPVSIPEARKPLPKIPPILLEGDLPSVPPASGPGERYALGPLPPLEKLESEGELPEAYGTKQMLLAARDPHWLYAHWDLTREQQLRYNALSADRHLILRIFADVVSSRPVEEIHVHPESSHWFVQVKQARTKYLAQLGYYQNGGQWIVIATSGPTFTPPDSMSPETAIEFAAIPVEVPMAKLLSIVKEEVHENPPLAEVLRELRARGHPDLPQLPGAAAAETKHIALVREEANRGKPSSTSRGAMTPRPMTPRQWTPAQERALARIISMDDVRRVWMGSMEITELIRRRAVKELASISAAQFGAEQLGAPTSPVEAIGGISSGAPGLKPAKGFWFNVNAELIVYGATERDATVTIGGRTIRLRPDGTFSYRFALPDGRYELPVVAVSSDQTDGRAAELRFSRLTEYRGDVGTYPQDPELKRPAAENLNG